MKHGDIYKHFKGGEYWFDCIALPLRDRKLSQRFLMLMPNVGTARYHENTHDLDLYIYDGITFIDSDLPHVIYQAEKDYNTTKVWAREVNDFFGYKEDQYGYLRQKFRRM